MSFIKYLNHDLMGNASTPVQISSATTYSLTNPCPSYVQANFTAAGQNLVLPDMGETNSLSLGEKIVIENTGKNSFTIKKFGGSIDVFVDLQPTARLEIVLLDTPNSQGTFLFTSILNGERVIYQEVTTANYEPDPSADCGKVFLITNNMGSIALLARSSYSPNFYFWALGNGGTLNNITANPGDLISGVGTITLNNYSSVKIINGTTQWLLASWIQGGFDPSTGVLQPPGGGTGRSTLTQHGVVIGNGTSPVNVTSAGATGTVLAGNTGSDPTFQTLSGIQTTLSKYIVGATQSTYTTISSAISAAVSDGASYTNPLTIFVKDGTYNEDISLPDGIFIQGLTPVNPILGLFAPNGTNGDTQVTGAVLTGKITLSQGSASHDTTGGISNFTISPSTGNLFELTGVAGASWNNTVNVINCKLNVNQTGKYVFNVAAGSVVISAVNCFMQDLTGDNTGYLLQSPNDATSSTFLTLDNCTTYVGQGATANTFNSNTNIIIRAVGGSLGTSFDATNCTTYFFRAFGGLVHYNQQVGNVVPYHVTGNSVSVSRIVYSAGCSIQGATGTDIATIGTTTEWQDSGVTFGGIGFGASSSTVTGGLQTRDCLIRTATSTYQKQLDLIRSGYAGASQFTLQAGVQTTNATTTTLASVTVNQTETITLKGTITAAQSDHTNAVGGDFLITARRASGGNVTLVGAAMANVNSDTAATFACDVDTGTQTVRIRVTGIAATTYNWVTTYTYQKILTNS